ncbi:MAG: DUF5127 domain-containing protein, partial [Planctomycetales bacterium]|nr:DUF5127 domain-containing protein [Planctomycetales bacterium]
MTRRLIALFCWLTLAGSGLAQSEFRPPAVPLVACDPYFSIWSQADKLTDVDTTHWTGKPHRLTSQVIVDGQRLRLMGQNADASPALPQTAVTVWPTRTIYEFSGNGIALTLTFMTPAFPESMEWLSWPITYVTYTVKSTDGKPHQVAVEFAANQEIAVDDPSQPTVWTTSAIEGLSAQRVGSATQTVLNRSGDDLRIDWGYLYVASPSSQEPQWEEHRLQLNLGEVNAS